MSPAGAFGVRHHRRGDRRARLVARRGQVRGRALDVVAVAASVVLPPGMTAFPEADGVLQRLMFGVAYPWYAREAFTLVRVPPRGSHGRPAEAGRPG